MSNKLIGIIIAILIIAAGGFYFTQDKATPSTQEEGTMMMEKDGDAMESDAMMEKDGDAMEGDAMMEKDGDAMEGDAMMEKDGDAMEGDAMMEKDGDAMEGDAMMEKDGDAMENIGGTMLNDAENTAPKGSYETYSTSKLSNANNGPVVLFFHASWCPTCRSLDTNISANEGDIPNGVTILKTNYDNETELRQKYGITMQHTLVLVDAEGNMIKKWTGSPTLASILAQIS